MPRAELREPPPRSAGGPSLSTSRLAELAPPPHERGLSSEEATRRFADVGRNRLVPAPSRSRFIAWLVRPFFDPMVLLLLVAGAVYVALGDQLDAIVVVAAVIPIAAVTLVLEVRSERALERLKALTARQATVWRDGRRLVIDAELIVPGDIILLHEGDIVPADAELVDATQMTTDESALTGESLPVEKVVGGDESERNLAAGTIVVSGRGFARVTTTGEHTAYGKIGALVAATEQPKTPLERSIHRTVTRLGMIAIIACIAVAAIELIRGAGWAAAIIAGVSLAIAAIPEEFAMVYALYLSLGAWRLARGRALVRRLAGVETLGATTVICADKTGTLTLGRLEVAAAKTAGEGDGAGDHDPVAEVSLLEAAVLASEQSPFDPIDRAILEFAKKRGVDAEKLHSGTLLRDYPFDPQARYLSHVWEVEGRVGIFAKGSLEGILKVTQPAESIRKAAIAQNESFAAEGMRVIAVARGDLAAATGERDRDERALHFAGLLAFRDPVRPGAVAALAECRRAGIRVIIITGDHPATAHAIAHLLDHPHGDARPVVTGSELDSADDATLDRLVHDATIFARTRPDQKHRIVRSLRRQGEVVAMTGDGINDGPALREADIGVALGEHGTEVARDAATLVLLDDDISTIVNAVRNGRRIYDNLRHAFAYLVAFHIPLVLTAVLAPLLGVPLFLLPVHLIWLELLVHPIASLVYEADPAAPDLMTRPPRPPTETLLSGTRSVQPIIAGLVMTIVVLGLYLAGLAHGTPVDVARTTALATLIVGQVGLVLTTRSAQRTLAAMSIRGNPMLIAALVVIPLTLMLAIQIAPLRRVLAVAPIGLSGWLTAAAGCVLITFLAELTKLMRNR